MASQFLYFLKVYHANVLIIGPLVLGYHITIAAGALFTKIFNSNVVLTGVPAKAISKVFV